MSRCWDTWKTPKTHIGRYMGYCWDSLAVARLTGPWGACTRGPRKRNKKKQQSESTQIFPWRFRSANVHIFVGAPFFATPGTCHSWEWGFKPSRFRLQKLRHLRDLRFSRSFLHCHHLSQSAWTARWQTVCYSAHWSCPLGPMGRRIAIYARVTRTRRIDIYIYI